MPPLEVRQKIILLDDTHHIFYFPFCTLQHYMGQFAWPFLLTGNMCYEVPQGVIRTLLKQYTIIEIKALPSDDRYVNAMWSTGLKGFYTSVSCSEHLLSVNESEGQLELPAL